MGSSDQTTNLVSANISLLKRKTNVLLVKKEAFFSQLKKSKQKLGNIGEENW
jgi:hypothetical protein